MDIWDWNERVHHDHDSDRGASRHSQLRGEPMVVDVERDINIIDVSPKITFGEEPTPAAAVPRPPPNPESLRLLDEIRNRNEDAARRLLDEGANLGTKDGSGKTALMLAMENNDTSMIQLLIERGADLEATDDDGRCPLFLAVQSSNIDLVELLLKFNPNIESLNSKTGKTAFHQAIEDGNKNIAELLLKNSADIDARHPDGQTALYTAVNSGNLDLVNFLLRHGANKKIELESGKTVEDVAEGDNAMMQLLQSSQLLEGPSMINPSTNPETRFIYTPALPADNIDKLYACRGFEATIVDFFGGDRERRIQVSSPIYDILYGKGPEAIMASARGSKMNGQKAMFRWYHLPANNMEWVQILASRISAEHHSGSMILDEDIKAKLALTNSPGRQYRATTAHSSFMRPLTQIVKPRIDSLDSSVVESVHDHVMLFIPYLHFETYRAFRRMSDTIFAVKFRATSPDRVEFVKMAPRHHSGKPAMPPLPAGWSLRSKMKDKSKITAIPSSGSDSNEADLSSRPGRLFPFQFVLRGTQKLQGAFQVLKAKARGIALGNPEDLEKGAPSSDMQNNGNDNVAPRNSSLSDSNDQLGKDRTMPNENPDTTGVMEKIPEEDANSPVDTSPNDTVQTTLNPMTDNVGDKKPEKHHNLENEAIDPVPDNLPLLMTSGIQAEGNEPKVNLDIPNAQEEPKNKEEVPLDNSSRNIPVKQKRKMNLGNLDAHLIKAYLSPNKPGEIPPLQLRRTLDQYYYTHLVNTAGRDSDQVVLRYTRQTSPEPKIFMVDQLWLWILNNDTIISCCPQRWDDSSEIPPTHIPQAPIPGQIPKPGPTHSHRPFDIPPRPAEKFGSAPPIPPTLLPPHPDPAVRPGSLGFQMPTKSKLKRKEKSSGVLGWMGGGAKRGRLYGQDGGPAARQRRDGSLDSNYDASDDGTRRRRKFNSEEAKERRQAFLKNDPLNVHQMILKYLQGSARSPITSVQDMANLVVGICVNVFDQYRVPDEYQFFEFFVRLFPYTIHHIHIKLQEVKKLSVLEAPLLYKMRTLEERSIGAVIDQEAQYFSNFAVTLANASRLGAGISPESDSLFSITAETQLLGEIKDISDELNILQMVLNDQLDTLKDFSSIMETHNGSTNNRDISSPATVRIENIKGHLHKLAKMEKLAKKTYKSLNHLLDLKQKQANVSEALIARKQAEKTSAQAEIAAKHAEQGMGQAELAYQQAMETARQGRTVMLFTVITIIFLPLSFVAAFFAINIDAFPINESGKLPLNYVLKYMFSISGAVSIPFILIAFNQDRIASWVRGHGKTSATWFTIIIAATILLSVFWTKSAVASGMKAALTAVIILAVVVGGLAHFIYGLVSMARYGASSSGGSSRSSLADD